MSSWVGPMPPLVMTRSYWSVSRRAASMISSSSSAMTSILRMDESAYSRCVGCRR